MANARKHAERSKYSSHSNNGAFKEFEFRANTLKAIKEQKKEKLSLIQAAKNMFHRTTNKQLTVGKERTILELGIR